MPKPRRRRPKLVRVTAREASEPELRESESPPECAHPECAASPTAPHCAATGDLDASRTNATDTAATETDPDVPDEPAGPPLCSPFILTDDHVRRLLDGALLMTAATAKWAHLLRRSHDIDILDCPKCHGRLRLMAVLRDQVQVRRILRHLGRPTEPPARAKARDPDDDCAA